MIGSINVNTTSAELIQVLNPDKVKIGCLGTICVSGVPIEKCIAFMEVQIKNPDYLKTDVHHIAPIVANLSAVYQKGKQERSKDFVICRLFWLVIDGIRWLFCCSINVEKKLDLFKQATPIVEPLPNPAIDATGNGQSTLDSPLTPTPPTTSPVQRTVSHQEYLALIAKEEITISFEEWRFPCTVEISPGQYQQLLSAVDLFKMFEKNTLVFSAKTEEDRERFNDYVLKHAQQCEQIRKGKWKFDDGDCPLLDRFNPVAFCRISHRYTSVPEKCRALLNKNLRSSGGNIAANLRPMLHSLPVSQLSEHLSHLFDTDGVVLITWREFIKKKFILSTQLELCSSLVTTGTNAQHFLSFFKLIGLDTDGRINHIAKFQPLLEQALKKWSDNIPFVHELLSIIIKCDHHSWHDSFFMLDTTEKFQAFINYWVPAPLSEGDVGKWLTLLRQPGINFARLALIDAHPHFKVDAMHARVIAQQSNKSKESMEERWPWQDRMIFNKLEAFYFYRHHCLPLATDKERINKLQEELPNKLLSISANDPCRVKDVRKKEFIKQLALMSTAEQFKEILLAVQQLQHNKHLKKEFEEIDHRMQAAVWSSTISSTMNCENAKKLRMLVPTFLMNLHTTRTASEQSKDFLKRHLKDNGFALVLSMALESEKREAYLNWFIDNGFGARIKTTLSHYPELATKFPASLQTRLS